MSHTNIAVIFDFDDTLAPESTSQLLKSYEIDVEEFWENRFAELIEDGYDPANAYLSLILEEIGEDRELGELTVADLRDFGSGLDDDLFPGLPEMFDDLEEIVSRFKDTSIDYYIVSSGLRNVILGTDFSDRFRGIYASELGTWESDQLAHIKRAVTFTEKTRYIFEINKGLEQEDARSDPYAVNEHIPIEERRVPFDNMIYIGDGLTDVPCFSLVRKNGGKAFGVFNPTDQSSRQKVLNFIDTPQRVQSMNSPKYRESDELGALIRYQVESLCSERDLDQDQAL
jgi:phosphoserine phosphatase